MINVDLQAQRERGGASERESARARERESLMTIKK
jgi:hypothetical protein